MSVTNPLQDIQHAGFLLLESYDAAERVILRREVFTVTDPVRDVKVLSSLIEVETIGHTRRFTNEERAAGLTISGSAVWVLDGFLLTLEDYRPAVADKIISPTLGTYVISEIMYEDNMARMNWEVSAMFSNQSTE